MTLPAFPPDPLRPRGADHSQGAERGVEGHGRERGLCRDPGGRACLPLPGRLWHRVLGRRDRRRLLRLLPTPDTPVPAAPPAFPRSPRWPHVLTAHAPFSGAPPLSPHSSRESSHEVAPRGRPGARPPGDAGTGTQACHPHAPSATCHPPPGGSEATRTRGKEPLGTPPPAGGGAGWQGRSPHSQRRDKGSLAAVPSSSKRHLTITCGRDGSVLTVPSAAFANRGSQSPGTSGGDAVSQGHESMPQDRGDSTARPRLVHTFLTGGGSERRRSPTGPAPLPGQRGDTRLTELREEEVSRLPDICPRTEGEGHAPQAAPTRQALGSGTHSTQELPPQATSA